MKSSARNQLNGVITQIVPAGGLCFLSILCGGETCIEAQISQSSLTRLKLAIGSTVVVMIKAPSVMLVTDLSPLELSAENCLPGVVKQVEQGVVNNVVTLALDTGAILTVYDMTKALSHDIRIEHIHLLHKSGGKHVFNR